MEKGRRPYTVVDWWASEEARPWLWGVMVLARWCNSVDAVRGCDVDGGDVICLWPGSAHGCLNILIVNRWCRGAVVTIGWYLESQSPPRLSGGTALDTVGP